MKIAHFSDLHLLDLEGVPPWRYLNKRFTGWANLRLKRHSKHRGAYVRAIAREVARSGVDHVVVTGDLTNLALETEYALARDVLERELGVDPSRLTIVPGNHDVYTRGAYRSRRFETTFAPWLAGDLPELVPPAADGPFPVVKLRGPAAIVALTSAVPQLPFVAAGALGRRQLEALARVLRHPEVARRTVVLALHHPAVSLYSSFKEKTEGLRDAPALLALLRDVRRGLVLHGHLHRRVRRAITTAHGALHHVGATSASLHHDEPDRMAGFNVYEVGDDGVGAVSAFVYEPQGEAFRPVEIPSPPDHDERRSP